MASGVVAYFTLSLPSPTLPINSKLPPIIRFTPVLDNSTDYKHHRHFKIFVHLQSVGNFVGNVNPSTGSFGVVSNNASAGYFREGEIPFLFVPFAQETIDIEFGHGEVVGTPAQIWDLGCNRNYHKHQHDTLVPLHLDQLTRSAHGRLTFICIQETARRSPALWRFLYGNGFRSTTKFLIFQISYLRKCGKYS